MLGGVDVAKGAGEISVVNGIIEQYKASTSTIDANTFVEFVNEALNAGTDTTISTNNYSQQRCCALLIDTNKVLLAHCNSYGHLNAIVCTISGKTINLGTDTELLNYQYSGYGICGVTLETNKVILLHRKSSVVYGTICTISGNNITIESDTQITADGGSYEYLSVDLIDTNKIFVLFVGVSSNYYLMGRVCTISNTTITLGTYITLRNAKYAGYNNNDVKAIDTNKVFIAHRNGGSSNSTNTYLSGMVCTVSGTDISVNTSTELVSVSGTSDFASVVPIGTNIVFISHRGENGYLNGLICTISGTTITAGTDTTLVPTVNSYYYGNSTIIDTNKVFTAHSKNSDFSLNGIISNISGTTITTDNDTILSSSKNSAYFSNCILVSKSKVFIGHLSDDTNKYINGIIVETPLTIKESVSKIDGITKTECTTTSEGEVYVL